MAKLDAFFKLMVEQGASDLHLTSGSQPILRVNGELQRIKYQTLESDDLKKCSMKLRLSIKSRILKRPEILTSPMKFQI